MEILLSDEREKYKKLDTKMKDSGKHFSRKIEQLQKHIEAITKMYNENQMGAGIGMSDKKDIIEEKLKRRKAKIDSLQKQLQFSKDKVNSLCT